MNKNYVIQWKSKVNGRTGRGTKLFERGEAERLVAELNREYPQIDHDILEIETGPAEVPHGQPAHEQSQESASDSHVLLSVR